MSQGRSRSGLFMGVGLTDYWSKTRFPHFISFSSLKKEKIFSGIHSDVLKLLWLGPAPQDKHRPVWQQGIQYQGSYRVWVDSDLLQLWNRSPWAQLSMKLALAAYPTGTKPSWYCGFPVFKVASLMPLSIVRYCVSSHSSHILHWYLLFGETQLLSRTFSANAFG